jgi:ATP-dependent DNA helicase RecG
LTVSTTAIENNISKLKAKGLLERIGPDKGGYWKIIDGKYNK